MQDLMRDLIAAGSVAALARSVGVSEPTMRDRLRAAQINPAATLKGHRIAGRSATARSAGVSLVSPHPDQIHFQKAATALSRIDRLGGHGSVFYSYAEHAVRVSNRVASAGAGRPERLAALLRYVPVAYVGHVPEAMRRIVGPRVSEAEHDIYDAVLQAAGLTMDDVDGDRWAEAEVFCASLASGSRLVDAPDAPFGMTPEIAAASFESLLGHLVFEAGPCESRATG